MTTKTPTKRREDPGVAEVFSDLVGSTYYSHGVARLEFLVERHEDAGPGKKPRAKDVVVARVALTTNALADLHRDITALLNGLIEQGHLKLDHSKEGKPN